MLSAQEKMVCEPSPPLITHLSTSFYMLVQLPRRALTTGATALHLAAFLGHSSVCAHLCTIAGAANAVDLEGATPMHAAAAGGRVDALRVLVERGGDLTVRLRVWPSSFAVCVLGFHFFR